MDSANYTQKEREQEVQALAIAVNNYGKQRNSYSKKEIALMERPMYYGAFGGVITGFATAFSIQKLYQFAQRPPVGNFVKFGTFMIGAMLGWTNTSRYFYMNTFNTLTTDPESKFGQTYWQKLAQLNPEHPEFKRAPQEVAANAIAQANARKEEKAFANKNKNKQIGNINNEDEEDDLEAPKPQEKKKTTKQEQRKFNNNNKNTNDQNRKSIENNSENESKYFSKRETDNMDDANTGVYNNNNNNNKNKNNDNDNFRTTPMQPSEWAKKKKIDAKKSFQQQRTETDDDDAVILTTEPDDDDRSSRNRKRN